MFTEGDVIEPDPPVGGDGGGRADPSPPPANGGIPLPTNEAVLRRLALTSERNPQRAHKIWQATLPEYGPNATAEQVGEVAAGVDGPQGLDKDAKRFLSAARKALKGEDSRAARQAFAIWRDSVRDELDRIAKADGGRGVAR
jgi:hypothetical protein